jgi:hypothetical protein
MSMSSCDFYKVKCWILGEILKHKCVEKSMCKAWAIIYLYF